MYISYNKGGRRWLLLVARPGKKLTSFFSTSFHVKGDPPLHCWWHRSSIMRRNLIPASPTVPLRMYMSTTWKTIGKIHKETPFACQVKEISLRSLKN